MDWRVVWTGGLCGLEGCVNCRLVLTGELVGVESRVDWRVLWT